MMYSKIINPITGRKVNINGKIGRLVLKSYINRLRGGQNKTVYMIYGRFQPPHKNHGDLIDALIKIAKLNKSMAFLFTSKKDNQLSDPKKAQSYMNCRSENSKKKKIENPIKIKDKLEILYKLHGSKDITIVDVVEKDISSPFDAVNWLLNNGYENIKFMVGTDRFLGFQKTFRKSGYENVEIIESERPIDGISGTEVRNLAIYTDIKDINKLDKIKNISKNITDSEIKNLEKIVKIYSKIKGGDKCYKNLTKTLNLIKNIKNDTKCEENLEIVKKIIYLIQNGSKIPDIII